MANREDAPPGRPQASESTYEKTIRVLYRHYGASIGRPPSSVWELAQWVADVKSTEVSHSSYQVYRGAVLFLAKHILELAEPDILELKHILKKKKSASPNSEEVAEAMGETRKPRAKSISDVQIRSMCLHIDQRLAKRSASKATAQTLRLFMHATKAVGARPSEWASATMEDKDGVEWVRLRTAKQQASSEQSAYRYIPLIDLHVEEKASVINLVHLIGLIRKKVEASSQTEVPFVEGLVQNEWQKWIERMQVMLRGVARDTFPDHNSRINLYTFRHEFKNRFKNRLNQTQLSSAVKERIIAALLGHGTVLTQTEYGDPSTTAGSGDWTTIKPYIDEAIRQIKEQTGEGGG